VQHETAYMIFVVLKDNMSSAVSKDVSVSRVVFRIFNIFVCSPNRYSLHMPSRAYEYIGSGALRRTYHFVVARHDERVVHGTRCATYARRT
jgi:hypothetical protein